MRNLTGEKCTRHDKRAPSEDKDGGQFLSIIFVCAVKALGKLGNIVAQTLSPTNVSPCFPEWANTRKHD
jgi:hypothetical protein